MLIFPAARLSRVRLFERRQTFTIFDDFIHLAPRDVYHVSFMKIIRLN